MLKRKSLIIHNIFVFFPLYFTYSCKKQKKDNPTFVGLTFFKRIGHLHYLPKTYKMKNKKRKCSFLSIQENPLIVYYDLDDAIFGEPSLQFGESVLELLRTLSLLLQEYGYDHHLNQNEDVEHFLPVL